MLINLVVHPHKYIPIALSELLIFPPLSVSRSQPQSYHDTDWEVLEEGSNSKYIHFLAETLAAGKRSQDILADLIKHQQLLIDCPSQVYRRIQIKMALGNSLDVRKFISLKIGGDNQGDDIQKGFVNQKDKPDKAISEHHTDITCLSKPSELLIVDYLVPSRLGPNAEPKVTQIDLYDTLPRPHWASIHELVDGRIDRIKITTGTTEEVYDNLPTATNATFHVPVVNISAEDIISFSTIVGNDSDACNRLSGLNTEVLMDFGIKLGWKAIMKPLFPKSIPGDLLALVHLSNRFDMRDRAPKLKVGDTATSEAKIASITNGETGKTATVKGTVFLLKDDEKPP
ncbi:hypothetical protein MJO28_007784 [Puccinia striiformis f. sp. tritici]|uniref:Uncharacterized protein n=1 Tax=Puccinia striiformis f. sp. tritici TaxID=168172 RepID=A0ACC0EG75_9BASI|nr:hypothetical protein MJO28_007784 [Puccinia striiformis f. sp. tritici]